MSNLDNVLFLSDVRISFPNLIEPQEQTETETGKKKLSWNAEFLMPPDSPFVMQFMQIYGKLAVEKWKEHAQTVMGLIQQDRKQRCYGMGQEKIDKKTFKPLNGYDGMFYLTGGNKVAPQMISGDGQAIDASNTMAYQQLARRIYGGCRVNATVKPWIQDNKHGRGIRLDLCAVQFCRDDQAFGEGHVDTSGMFKPVAAAPAAAPAMPTMPGMPFPGAGLPGAPVAPAMPSFPMPGQPAGAAAPALPPFLQG